MSDLPDYALTNRELWTRSNARYTDAHAHDSWAADEVHWGVFKTPESELRAVPDVRGCDVIELGCGTAYFGAWLKKRGASRVVGVDVTPAQLATARRMEAEFGLGLEFIEANAEAVPLPDGQFDVAFSEYGASIWCDPAKWIPEASRLLRPGGQLVFLRCSVLQILCSAEMGPVQERLVQPQRGLYRVDWPAVDEDDLPGSEFHPPHGVLFGILRDAGFELLDLIEVYAPYGAVDHPYYNNVPAEWAKKWPIEEIWKARKRMPEAPDGNE